MGERLSDDGGVGGSVSRASKNQSPLVYNKYIKYSFADHKTV